MNITQTGDDDPSAVVAQKRVITVGERFGAERLVLETHRRRFAVQLSFQYATRNRAGRPPCGRGRLLSNKSKTYWWFSAFRATAAKEIWAA